MANTMIPVRQAAGLQHHDGRERFYRAVYSVRRNGAPIAFYERQDQTVGPVFTLTASGSF